jgi:lipopolysaccharide/colanic/teichoic acid biosynthesis glycosyltransferase
MNISVNDWISRLAKRSFDLLVSILGLIVFAPLMLAIAFFILVTLGRPAMYSPRRVGKSGNLFTVHKFRTMTMDDTATSHHSGDDDPRITTEGRWMRKFKLDEVPQLLNVGKGEMSFVGPRPETPDYTKLYTDEQKVILELRPGITDFASIEFADLGAILVGDDPDKIYFEKVRDRKMELRMKYVRERSFWIDLKLIFLTFAAVINRKK